MQKAVRFKAREKLVNSEKNNFNYELLGEVRAILICNNFKKYLTLRAFDVIESKIRRCGGINM